MSVFGFRVEGKVDARGVVPTSVQLQAVNATR